MDIRDVTVYTNTFRQVVLNIGSSTQLIPSRETGLNIDHYDS